MFTLHGIDSTIFIFFVLTFIIGVFAENDWTFQAKLVVDGASNYGQSSFAIFGRGFTTAISGYDISPGGIFVHTTNYGVAASGSTSWSLQARLQPADLGDSDEFGKYFVADKHTIMAASPMRSSGRGAVYVFNGTQETWTQIQKLVVNNLGSYFLKSNPHSP
jgi:hypothetical protein